MTVVRKLSGVSALMLGFRLPISVGVPAHGDDRCRRCVFTVRSVHTSAWRGMGLDIALWFFFCTLYLGLHTAGIDRALELGSAKRGRCPHRATRHWRLPTVDGTKKITTTPT